MPKGKGRPSDKYARSKQENFGGNELNRELNIRSEKLNSRGAETPRKFFGGRSAPTGSYTAYETDDFGKVKGPTKNGETSSRTKGIDDEVARAKRNDIVETASGPKSRNRSKKIGASNPPDAKRKFD